MLRALLYAYVLGGLTFIPLLIAGFIFITIYTSVPVGDADITKKRKAQLESLGVEEEEEKKPEETLDKPEIEINDTPKARKGWLTIRRTFEETVGDGSYVTLMRSFLDSRSKDPKRSRPKDMWYVALKGKVLYLYEDEEMTECDTAIELSSHQVLIYPEDLPDGELFAKRNAICLRPKSLTSGSSSLKEKRRSSDSSRSDTPHGTGSKRESSEPEKKKDSSRQESQDTSSPWYIFVKANIEMEDWYFSLLHASEQPAQTPTLLPLRAVFEPVDMNHLVSTLDEQPDVIPMRWLNALIGRIFFSHYRTHNLEAYIIGRLMKKLTKIKRPAFLTEIAVTEVSVGNRAPMLSKPMLKELTKEGDASLEVHLHYKGEIRLTVEATAVINLGARFKSYTVKVVLAVVLKEIEGNLLIKVKRPPSNRIWYAFTQTPKMVLEVEPIVSDRQITWGMILSTIESKLKEVIQESVVMPNMDDIAFFESSEYEHRGGIWADACRKPHVPATATSPDLPSDAQSTASAPAELPTTVAPEPELQQPVPTATTLPSPPFLDETVSLPASVEDSRRKSWFSSVRSDDSAATTPIPTFNRTDTSDDDQRGRTLEQEKPSARSLSTRSQPESVRAVSPEQSTSDTNDSQSGAYLIPSSSSSSTRRSSSQHSIKYEYDPNDLSDSSDSRARSNPATPRKSTDSGPIPRSPSPPSFFSTLKSKAADKQAVSNAAKEAMRKWGVNWGGFKKDNKEEEVVSNDNPAKNGQESSLAHKARTSYADVRAAVAERKEREKVSTDDSADLLTPTPFTAARQRAASGSSSIFSSGSLFSSETTANPSIVSSTARPGPKLNNKKSTPSLSRVQTEMDNEDLPVQEAAKPTPIHVQPQAKTMSIPGIHASHKGDVQSLGYVAPQAQAPPPTNPADTVLKNPAIQKVYQLWKTPSSGSSVSDTDTNTDDGYDLPKGNSAANDVGLTLTSTPAVIVTPLPPAAVKPSPPPLPPRSVSTRSPFSIPSLTSDAPPSTASQALKDIVIRDEERHAQANVDSETPSSSDFVEPSSGSNLETGNIKSDVPSNQDSLAPSKTPPALPPRRITTVT